MNAMFRVLLVLGILGLTLAPLPSVAADDCVQLDTATFASDGLRVIANAGREIDLGIRSSTPGDGLGLVLRITPAVCGGFGVGGVQLSGGDPTQGQTLPPADPVWLVENAPSFIPLP